VLYGFKAGAKFYGVNLKSELDSPGEYYVDRYLISPRATKRARWTDRQTGRQADRQTDRQTSRQTDRLATDRLGGRGG
jgi:uncharacterized protein involved in high-affinity Fe2+ transport